MKARLLQDHAVSVFCKHGLHRSAAGARQLSEELASEGYLVWVFNLGCSERWWAKQYKLVETYGFAVAESGASHEQVAQRLSTEWRSINSSLDPSSQFDPSHISPPVIHRCQQEVAAASPQPGTPPDASRRRRSRLPGAAVSPAGRRTDHALASRSLR